MSDKVQESEAAPPPHVQLIQFAMAPFVSKVVYAAARLGLADHLAAGPKTAAELAGPTKTHGPSLHRLLRTLAGLGLLSQVGGQRFALTPVGEALQTGAPGAARSAVLTLGSPPFVAAFEEILHSLQTGETGFQKALGMPIFDYLGKHPEEARLFSETMIGFHGAEPPAVAAAYDFSKLGTVVDVGGATGNMLSAILARFPGVKGVLFDLPHVVRDAGALLQSRGVAGRVGIESGSFFERVPSGGDAYLLSHIIHDWNEEQCLAILGNCRKAMKPGARLLIVEMVLPEEDVPHPGKMLDMVMLVVPGGRERTAPEYAELLGKAGFRVQRVVPTESPVSIVEALPA